MDGNARILYPKPDESPLRPFLDSDSEASCDVRFITLSVSQAFAVSGLRFDGNPTYDGQLAVIRIESNGGSLAVQYEYDIEDLALHADEEVVAQVRASEREFASGEWSTLADVLADEDDAPSTD